MKLLKHIAVILAGVSLLLVLPFWLTGGFHSLFAASLDAVSSASVVLDQPSGNFLVLINKAQHADESALMDWEAFFTGGDFLYIFEDVSVSVSKSDPTGVELAKSFQSQLPENQMKVYLEEGTMLLSRADVGLYDMLILSVEYAEAMHWETVHLEDALLLQIRSEE